MTASLVGWKVVNSTSASITSVSVDPSSPTGGSAIATGDLCVLLCVGGVTAAGNWAASGFTSMHLLTQGTRRYGALRRVRQSGDSSYTATCPTTNGAQVVLVWFRDFDATLTGLVVGSEYHRTASGSTTAAPSVTSTVNDSLIACFGLEASTASESDVTSISQGTKAFFAAQTTTPQIHTTVVSTLVKSTAGASGTTTITYPNAAANGFGFQLAIPPAVATNADPVAEFSSVRTGLTVQFTDASTDADGTITARAWDFDDGATSTATNPSHTFAAGAAYDVQLTVTDDDSATDSVTHTVTIPATAESSTRTLYDHFARYSDGLTPAGHDAISGHTWDVYSPPDAVTGGLWDSTDDTAAYLNADGTDEVTYIAARFLWDTRGGTRTANTGTVAIGVTNDIANLAARKFRAHLVLTPAAAQLSVQTTAGGSLSSVGSQPVSTTKDAYHLLEMTLQGTTATVYVDGSQVAQWTDARLAEDAAQHQVFFEPYYNNDASAVRARFEQVWADWGAPIAGTLSASLPLLTGAVSGGSTNPGAVDGQVPKVTGSISGQSTNPGTLSASVPKVTGALSGTATNPGTLAGTFPALAASINGQSANPGTLNGSTPLLAGTLAGQSTNPGSLAGTLPLPLATISDQSVVVGTLAGTLPLLTGSIAGQQVNPGALAGTLPRPTGALTGGSTNPATMAATLPVLAGAVTGTLSNPGVLAAALPLLRGLVEAAGGTHSTTAYRTIRPAGAQRTLAPATPPRIVRAPRRRMR